MAFLSSQSDYIFFCYGLALILLAVTSLTLERRGETLLPWKWLALFGAVRGIREWLGLLAYSTGANPVLNVTGAGLVFLSCMFLAEFGREGVARLGNGKPRRFIIPLLAAVSLSGLLEGVSGLESTSNIAAGLIGGLLSAYALILLTRKFEAPHRRLLMVAGAAMAGHSLVSAMPFAPAGLSLEGLLGNGAPGVLAPLAGGLLLVFVTTALITFYQTPSTEGRKMFLAQVYIMVAVLAAGLFGAWLLGSYTERENNANLKKRALAVAASLDPHKVAMLTGTKDDLHSPYYRDIRSKLVSLHRVYDDCRYLYLMGMKDGKMIFLVDSEPEASRDFTRPGDVYADAKPRDFEDYQAGKSTVYQPYTDSWGTWVSGIAPVVETQTGRILAEVGLDMDADKWVRNIAFHRLLIIAITASFCMVGIYLHLSWLKIEHERNQRLLERAESERLLKESQARLELLAHHDTLTGLPNRALFNFRLEHALRQARRHKHTSSLIFLDLDNFKTINDTMGHDAGDQLLKAAAERFRGCVREEDTIARLGGDEFAVILPEIDGVHSSCRLAERLLESLKEPLVISGRQHYAGISMGIAFFPGDGKDPQALLSSADIALYCAKESGKNNYKIFTHEMDKRVRERAGLETAIREALSKKEFVVHYQPQVDLATGRVVCMEALLRWNKPDEGIVYPGRFIPAAEDSRLIIPLGAWVLKEACRQCTGWGTGTRVAVNLSARQFHHGDLANVVEGALKETGLSPERLELELTESSIMHDVESAARSLEKLHGIGVRISIDDFGTGYSSLSYIKKFPIHVLKIDRTFISNVNVDKNNAAISAAVIAMAHALNMQVVAEGVETGQQMEFLKGSGCDLVQGNLLSRPLPAEDAGLFLITRGGSILS